MTHPANYRTRLLFDFLKAFVLPGLVLFLALKLFYCRLGVLAVPIYSSFFIVWASARSAWVKAIQVREAKKLGARPIPCVVGKWPGNIDILLKMMRTLKTSYFLDVHLQLFEEYKSTTLNTRILWTDSIISMDQEHSKFVLSTGFQQFWRGKKQKERMETFLGEGIFNRDDDIWKMHRANARPFFDRERNQDLDKFETYCSRTLAIISSLEASNEPCEAQDLYSRFSLDAASEFLFGKNLDTLSASLPRPGKTPMGPKGSATEGTWGEFTQAFEASQMNVMKRGQIGNLWPLFEIFGDKNKPHAEIIQRWVDPLVSQAFWQKAQEEKSGIAQDVTEKTLIQHLADMTTDQALIRDQLLNMLLASRDTTASTLTFITYFMAMHPHVAQRMRAEALEYCGSSALPSLEHFKHLKYIRAVINETLRLFPPVPLNVRETRSSACLLPPSDPTYHDKCPDSRPLYMPADTVICYFPLLTQRNPALWGSDADEFKPERWLQPEQLAKVAANPAMFAPFSAGPRTCIGQNYAYNEMTYFLVKLLQQFDRFTLAPEFQPEGSLPPPEWKHRKGRQRIEKVWPSSALTLFVKGGMWVYFHKADS